MSGNDNHTPEEIAHGTTEFMNYMEECDGHECAYTYEALMAGSVLLYDFKEAA